MAARPIGADALDRLPREHAWDESAPNSRQPSEPFRSTGSDPPTIEALLAIVHDAQAAAAARSEAAVSLVTRAMSSDEAQGSVATILSGPATELSASWFILGALSRQSSLPEWLLDPVAGAMARADDRTAARAVMAMSSVRTRASARRILAMGAPDRPEVVRRSAWSALGRLTGRSDLGDSAAAWGEWIERADLLSEEEWLQLLSRGLARRADSLEALRQAAIVRLVEANRRVHVSLPPDQRSEFLAGLLRDDTDEVRALGFEMVSRELSENSRLGSAVEAAAIALLDSASASVRERAGILIAQLGPAEAREAVSSALGRETDPSAASALLRAASRWPDESLTGIALRWIKSDGSARDSAAEYLRVAARAGLLRSDTDRTRVLDAIRALPPERVPPGACDLLVQLGDEDDARRVATLLSVAGASVRMAAAQSLLVVPEHLDDILLAAQKDPELFDIAARAVSMYWPTAPGFRAVSALPAPSDDAWRRGLLRVAELMPSPDIVAVSRTIDPALREPVLANLASVNRILSERLSDRTFAALGEGLVDLAALRIELNRPDAALAALDAMPELPILRGEAVVNALRAEALLCLGRVVEAEPIAVGPEVWISALARCADKPFAPVIAAGIRSRYSDRLTPEQARHFALLSRHIGAEDRDDEDPESR